MLDIFEVTDPRGYKVKCSETAWQHILGNRSYMVSWIDEIKAAIEQPNMGIYQDVDFSDREIYYMLRMKGKDRYLKVVVEIQGSKAGTVVTAFPTYTPKAGEKLIWPTSNP